MNETLLNYTFSPSTKELTLTDIVTVKQEAIGFIFNETTNSFIWAFNGSYNPIASIVGNLITFTNAMTGMNSSDKLKIQYFTSTSLDIQNISVSSLPLPSGASTGAKQDTGNNSLSSIDGKIPTNGIKTNAASLPIVISSEQAQDTFITGQSSQSTLGNNIFLAIAGSTSVDTFSNGVTYRSFYTQIVASVGISAGQIIFEGSNNNITFHTLTWYDDSVITGAIINTATAIAASTNRFFSGRTGYRYIRCRISTAFVGGTIQALTRFSTKEYTPRIVTTSQATGQTFSTTLSASLPAGTAAVGAVGLVNGTAVTDIASAALITTTTTAAITPGNIMSAEFQIAVTAVSGTTPTLDVQIQISKDAGTNWIPIYDFPRITTTGIYYTPILRLEGNRIRYVQTVSGTTPSFTRSLVRNGFNSIGVVLRQQVNRGIDITTLNSVTPGLWIEGNNEAILVFATGANAISTAAILTLEGSEDNLNWYDLGNITVTGTAINSTYQTKVSGILSKFLRVRVSTAGVGGSLNYVSIKTRGQ